MSTPSQTVTGSVVENFTFWCRSRSRKDLESLERIAVDLEEYAEKHDLIADAPACAFGRGKWWATDLSDPRSVDMAKALVTLQREIQWVRDQLTVFERRA